MAIFKFGRDTFLINALFLLGFSSWRILHRSWGIWDRFHHVPVKTLHCFVRQIVFFLKKLGPLIYLDVFEVKWLFTVFTVEGSLGAFTFIVTFLFIQSNELFTQGTGQNHELTFPFMVQLQKNDKHAIQ